MRAISYFLAAIVLLASEACTPVRDASPPTPDVDAIVVQKVSAQLTAVAPTPTATPDIERMVAQRVEAQLTVLAPTATATTRAVPSVPSSPTATQAPRPTCGSQFVNNYAFGTRQTLRLDTNDDTMWFSKGGSAVWLEKGRRWVIDITVWGYDRTFEYYITDRNESNHVYRRISGTDHLEFVAPFQDTFWLGMFNPSWAGNKTVEVKAMAC